MKLKGDTLEYPREYIKATSVGGVKATFEGAINQSENNETWIPVSSDKWKMEKCNFENHEICNLYSFFKKIFHQKIITHISH